MKRKRKFQEKKRNKCIVDKRKGGKAVTYDATTNVMTLTNMAPGDEVRFSVNITNDSTINTKYRVQFEVSDLEDGVLSEVLECGIITSEEEKSSSIEWTFLEVNSNPESVSCYVSLPGSADNTYQTSSAEVKVVVEAIQGNATTSD